MSQLTLRNLLEPKFGPKVTGSVLKDINYAFREGQCAKVVQNHFDHSLKRTNVIDESGIAHFIFS